MATAGELVDILALRIRDPGNTAHPRILVRRVLAEAQRLVNAETRALLAETTLDLDPGSVVLDLARLLPWAVRVETVRHGGRDLGRCGSWRELAEADRLWLGRRGGTPRVWCHFTPSKVLLSPAPADFMQVTLVTTRRTRALPADSDPLELPPNLYPAILDLSEQLLLARQRLFAAIEPAAQRFPQALADTAR
jgi:hypothetical protein